MKKRIRIWALFLAQYTSAITQLRFKSPFSFFPQDEFEFVYAPSLKAILKLLNIPQVIVFHRNTYPFREINQIIKFARLCGIVTVLDMDDLLTHIPPAHPAYVHLQKIKVPLIELLKKVDIVIVANKRLKEYYQRYTPNIYILPNFLDKKIWNNKVLKESNENKIVIGYAGLPTHVYDFKVVVPAIKYILSKYNGKVCFKFVGCMLNELKTMPGVEHISEIVSYKEYANLLMKSNFDFVIAPLEDNVFNRCKSNIKFLEYSSCGYAGIYSAVGPYIDSIVSGKTGLLIKNETSEWIRAMELLIDNPELRKRLGRNALQYVMKNFSQEERLKEWYKFYSRILISFWKRKNIKKHFSRISCAYFLIYMQVLNIYYKIRGEILAHK